MKGEGFSGYVLAGGRSARMGRDKAFLKIAGRTFVKNASEILKPLCGEKIKLVLNKKQTNFAENLPSEFPRIFDSFENHGALGGMHRAFSDCRTEFAVILAVDLPLVTTSVIEKLTQTALRMPNSRAAVIPRASDFRLQPLCGIYRKKICLPALEAFLKESENPAVRDFLKLIEIEIAEPSLFQKSGEDVFFNVNRSVDFEKISGEK